MARPIKKTVDYFPHYATHGTTMFVIENRWGNDGYSFWFKLLEILCSKEGMFFDCNNPANWQFLLAKTKLDEDKANEILNGLSDLDAINGDCWKKKVIFSENLVDNVTDAFRRRKELLPTLTIVIDYINLVIDKEVKQKPPKGKGNEIKVNKSIYGVGENILLTDDQHRKLKEKLNGRTNEYIDRLSTYRKLNQYKDHYLTILSWWNKDNTNTEQNKPEDHRKFL